MGGSVQRLARRAGMAFGLASLATAAVAGGPALAQEFTGAATVIGSDTIDIGGQRILLYGLESIETGGHTCTIDGARWECWPAAVRQLQTLVEAGPVTCSQVGDKDLLGRVLATCVVAGEDLGAQFIRSGFALAVEKENPAYVEIEAAAKAQQAGLWRGEFLRPSEWRRMNNIEMDRP